MSNTPIRILLVDDHIVVRDSWKLVLENNPLFRVIAECENGNEAISKIKLLTPDIVLLDVNIFPGNGLDLTQEMLQAKPGIKIIGLSVGINPRFAYKMIETGAAGYITKTSSLGEINKGILEVHKGNIYVCEEIKRLAPLPDRKDG